MAKKKGGKQRPTSGGAAKGAKPSSGGAPPSKKAVEPKAPTESAPERLDPGAKAEPEKSDRKGSEPKANEPPAAAAFETLSSLKDPQPPRQRRPEGREWGKPFVSIEKWWTWLEVRILVGVILGLVFSMVLWVALQGMSSPVESESKAGVVFRGAVGAIAISVATWFVTGKLGLDRTKRTLAAIGGIAAGVLLAPSWRGTGVEYFGHVQNWLQEGSSFTMFGQLRGVSTRLTVVLAFIGASLGAASGKHINIDAALRFVKDKYKLPVFVLQTIATVAFCVAASWAFFEYIAITNFNAKPDMTASQKYEIVDDAVAKDLFLLRRQIGFDLSAAPHVIGGGKWDDEDRFTGRQWNEYLEETGYRDYFTDEQVDGLKSPEGSLDTFRYPLAIGPDGPPRNTLVRTMNLSFTVGFFLMALRFLLRLLLVLSGHQSMDAEAEYDPDADPKRHKEREAAAVEAAHEAGSKEIV